MVGVALATSWPMISGSARKECLTLLLSVIAISISSSARLYPRQLSRIEYRHNCAQSNLQLTGNNHGLDLLEGGVR